MQRKIKIFIWLSVLLIIGGVCVALFLRIPNANFKLMLTLTQKAPPTLPNPPALIALPQNTPENQSIYFSHLLESRDTRLSGWLGLYNAVGVPVIGQDGAPLGNTGNDPIGPRYWQLWYISGLDRPQRGITLNDAARLITVSLPNVDDGTLGTLLLNDLRLAIQSADPKVRLLGMFIRERVLRGPSHIDLLSPTATPRAIIIDIPTVHLMGWVTMRGLLIHPSLQASVSGQFTLAAYNPELPQKLALSPQLYCSDLPGAGSDAAYWVKWITSQLGGGFQLPGMQKAFPGIIQRIVNQLYAGQAWSVQQKRTKLAGDLKSWGGAFASAVSLALQLAAMEVRAVQDPDPLERTKYSTYPGKEGNVILQIYSEPDSIPDGNELETCLGSLFYRSLGIAISFPSKGPIPNTEVTFEGGVGFPDLVFFDRTGSNTYKFREQTDNNGQITIKVLGREQKSNIPDSARPVNKEFSIIVSAQPEEAAGKSIFNIFFGGLSSSPASAIGSLINILKTFHWSLGEYVFRLKDWAQVGYKATGKYEDKSGKFEGKYSCSGVVCSLEKEFTIPCTLGEVTITNHYSPSTSKNAGSTFHYGNYENYATFSGNGTYTVTEYDTSRLTLKDQSHGITKMPVPVGRGADYDWDGTIELEPLDTDECSSP